jgi:hypothetical protein
MTRLIWPTAVRRYTAGLVATASTSPRLFNNRKLVRDSSNGKIATLPSLKATQSKTFHCAGVI